MRFLLDTVTFIWALSSPELLSKRAKAALEHRQAIPELSVVSITEIAIKQAKGKLDFDLSHLLAGIADLKLRVLSYTGDHAMHLFGLPEHHSDPFDRLIIVQALAEQIPVISPDSRFKLYKGLRVVW